MTGVSATEGAAFSVNMWTQKAKGSLDQNIGQSFEGIMNESKNQAEGFQKTTQPEGKIQKTNDVTKQEMTENPQNNQSDRISKEVPADNQPTSQADSENDGKIQEAAEEIVKEVADALGVTDEDVMSAMEILGVSIMDLTDPICLARLSAEVLEEVDGMALVTDEALFSQVTELSGQITGELSELAKELSVEADELALLLDEAVGHVDENEQDVTVSTEIQTEIQTEKQPENKQIPKTVHEDFSAVEEKDHYTELKNGKSEIPKALEQNVESEPVTEQSRDKESGREKNQSGSQNQTTGSFSQQSIVSENGMEAFKTESFVSATSIDPESILNQIGEAVRITSKEEFTSMEMQLNPENLGTLHLQVRAKEGIVTAQFTTENETVKQVLEAQVIQLKERLEAQGVKVEAVEVLVASHEFERNLEKGSEDKKNTYAAKKVTRRKINLNVLQEDEEAGTEVEQEALLLQKDMMRRNGNTLDYMV